MTSFYTDQELQNLGLKEYGTNVLISRKCSIYGASHISIGNNVRIDDFCILSGNIKIGNYVHISAYTSMFSGDSHIVIGDFVALSSRNVIYAESDDYSGESMVNPMVPDEYKGRCICRSTFYYRDWVNDSSGSEYWRRRSGRSYVID